MTSQDLHSRRKLLAATGTAITTGLAGCTELLSEDEETTPTENDDSYQDNGSDNGNGSDDNDSEEPEYSLTASIPSTADLTQNDYLKIELEINREYSNETETIEPEAISIEESYNKRTNEQYTDELLEEVGLYQENTVEHETDNKYQITKNELLPGQTQLHLKIEVEDPEYGTTENYEINETLDIEKTSEETRNDIQVENPELWKELRQEYIENSLEDRGWMQLTKEVEQEIDFEQDTEEILDDLNWSWAQKAGDKMGGPASGQTDELMRAIEYISHNNEEMEKLHAHVFSNGTHDTAGAYNDEKTWDVESAGHNPVSPPVRGRIHQRDPEQTSLMNPEGSGMKSRAARTIRTMIDLQKPSLISELRDENPNYLKIEEETATELMERIREKETGRLEDQTLETLRNYSLTSALSPTTGIELKKEDI